MPYWKLNYHLVWSTRQRVPVLNGEMGRVAKASILASATKLGVRVHSISVQPDHVHLAFAAPPKWSVADIAQRVKGSSSHHLGKEFGEAWMGWQAEYGVVGFGEQSLGRVIRYVANQEEHHREDRLWLEMERVPDELTGETVVIR
ncbi:MAG TPA: IS200/IS605 family transposase [Thermomicrobiales bacterium]|nr:IS200/IS605 family transposase [Thermomicrobiales bacterium]